MYKQILILFLLILITTVTFAGYESQYPIAYNTDTVKVSTINGGTFNGYQTMNPALSLIGGWDNTQWLSLQNNVTNQRFHIDLNQTYVIKRIYYENGHSNGGNTKNAPENFTFWGTNSSSSFDEMTYGTDTGWTQLVTSQSTLDEHTESNIEDPKYITVTNSIGYRYYGFKFADIRGGESEDYMGVRRIELQISEISITADYEYEIDKINEQINFTDTTTDFNTLEHIELTDWNWYVDTVLSSTDQNWTKTGVNQYEDYNVALNVCGTYDTNIYCDYIEKTASTGKWFGDTNFYFYDELTGLDINATIDFNGTEYTGTSFYLPSRQITNESSTNSTYTFTITKTGYGTRYYTTDMNKYTDLNVGFLMLPDTNGSNVQFKFYETDQTTILSNADILVRHTTKAYNTISKRKTNSSGEITFFLNTLDSGYTFHITASDEDTFDYNTVSLTISKPRSESTGLTIDANWGLVLGGLSASSDLNIDSTSSVLAIYSDTIRAYIITISSNSLDPIYYSRKYELFSTGNTAILLQPFLSTTDESTQIKLVTNQDDGADVKAYPGITIKIYKFLPALGRSLIEQVITDAKGEALVYLIVGDTYEFEVYDSSGNLIPFEGTLINDIKVTSADIYFTVNTSSGVITSLGQNYWYVTWDPTNTSVTKLTTGTKTFKHTVFNDSLDDLNIISYYTQNDVNLAWKNTISSLGEIEITMDSINWADLNIGNLEATIIIYKDQNYYVFKYHYVINKAFGGYYNPIIDGLQNGIRKDLSCPATGLCVPTLIIAWIVCVGMIIFLSLKTHLIGGQGAAGIFVAGTIFFTYLNWVPLELTLVVVVIVAAFIINDKGGRGE